MSSTKTNQTYAAKQQPTHSYGYYATAMMVGMFLMGTSVTVMRLKEHVITARFATCNVVDNSVNCDLK